MRRTTQDKIKRIVKLKLALRGMETREGDAFMGHPAPSDDSHPVVGYDDSYHSVARRRARRYTGQADNGAFNSGDTFPEETSIDVNETIEPISEGEGVKRLIKAHLVRRLRRG